MKQKLKKEKPLTPDDHIKLDIAEELGLLEQVRQHGWGSLTAKETGRIGGMVTRRKQLERMKASQNHNKDE